MNDTDSVLRMNEELGLAGIVVKSLPATLGTTSEPERYTVTVGFTRRPLDREVAIIEGDLTRMELTGAGYEGVSLTAVDHRLEIGGTNLQELKAGLATLIAVVVQNASVAVAAQEATRVADLKIVTDREERRAELVAASAAQVVFEVDQKPRPEAKFLRAL